MSTAWREFGEIPFLAQLIIALTTAFGPVLLMIIAAAHHDRQSLASGRSVSARAHHILYAVTPQHGLRLMLGTIALVWGLGAAAVAVSYAVFDVTKATALLTAISARELSGYLPDQIFVVLRNPTLPPKHLAPKDWPVTRAEIRQWFIDQTLGTKKVKAELSGIEVTVLATELETEALMLQIGQASAIPVHTLRESSVMMTPALYQVYSTPSAFAAGAIERGFSLVRAFLPWLLFFSLPFASLAAIVAHRSALRRRQRLLDAAASGALLRAPAPSVKPAPPWMRALFVDPWLMLASDGETRTRFRGTQTEAKTAGHLHSGIWVPEHWASELTDLARGDKVAVLRSATEFSLKRARAA